ncbi:unnamed protein product [Periconia digitata]|uniref:Uncharacterized protein n=1 Tax=Periconia digitata TaxID=1303443 RepID=A0A9W4XTU7_9PLEO|nr:unnamed protein product [Periconia digitata]
MQLESLLPLGKRNEEVAKVLTTEYNQKRTSPHANEVQKPQLPSSTFESLFHGSHAKIAIGKTASSVSLADVVSVYSWQQTPTRIVTAPSPDGHPWSIQTPMLSMLSLRTHRPSSFQVSLYEPAVGLL